VFMQFNRICEADRNGFANEQERQDHKHGPKCLRLEPLPKPSVDTGMGLERITAVLQSVVSNYETDLFLPLIERAEGLAKVQYGSKPRTDASLRIIADHSRAATFLISDGVLPANDGRGYVLRKIIRRAMRHGRLLGISTPFMAEVAYAVRDLMQSAYPELQETAGTIYQVLLAEERRFAHTVEAGLQKLEERFGDARKIDLRGIDSYIEDFDEQARISLQTRLGFLRAEKSLAEADDATLDAATKELFGKRYAPDVAEWVRKTVRQKPLLDGTAAFQLYDTYGLALDFMLDAARDQGIEIDISGFQRAMEEQRTRARASWKGVHKETASPVYAKLAETFRTEPDFYFGTHSRDCRIEAIVTKNGLVKEVPAGAEAEIVLDRTVIYSESGGQMADTGAFYDNDQTMEVATVRGAYYPVSGLIAHRIVAKEKLCVGDRVAVAADAARREHIKRNHTGTHLMHAALRNILGTHVKQAGSLVAPDHLRFDFTHFAGVDADELREIEQQVNEQLLGNHEVDTDIMNIDAALASGALAFFGDRYPEQNVRVVTIADPAATRGFYSKELCGGTHVRRAGDIGVFKIVGEQSVAAGVRRVEAITGSRALEAYQKSAAMLQKLSQALNAGEDELLSAVERMSQTARQMEKQIDGLKKKAAHSMVDELLEQARTMKDVRVLAAKLDEIDRGSLRQLVDTLRQRMGSGVVVLGTVENGKVALIAGVTKDLTARIQAGKIIQETAKLVGGSGGGRPDLAEAGGKDTAALEGAIAQVYLIVERML